MIRSHPTWCHGKQHIYHTWHIPARLCFVRFDTFSIKSWWECRETRTWRMRKYEMTHIFTTSWRHAGDEQNRMTKKRIHPVTCRCTTTYAIIGHVFLCFLRRVKLKEGVTFLGARPSNPTQWIVSQDVRSEGHRVVTLHCRRKESSYDQQRSAHKVLFFEWLYRVWENGLLVTCKHLHDLQLQDVKVSSSLMTAF